jgi:hypothetical protein
VVKDFGIRGPIARTAFGMWKNFLPSIFIIILMAGSFGLINMSGVITGTQISFVNDVKMQGVDYKDYFEASTNIINNISPYQYLNDRYVTTPFPALLNVMLLPFGFKYARLLFQMLIPISLLLAWLLACRAFDIPRKNGFEIVYLVGFVFLLFGYPFYFLWERGNIDSFVVLAVGLGLFFHKKGKSDALSGLCFALAIALKIYPVLFLLPMVFYRRWSLLKFSVIWSVVIGVICLPWAGGMPAILLTRMQPFVRWDENGSLVASLDYLVLYLKYLFGLSVETAIAWLAIVPWLSVVVYGMLLCGFMYLDLQAGKIKQYFPFVRSAMMYTPFMVIMPALAYHYELILLLLLVPVIQNIWNDYEDRLVKTGIITASIGIAMSQWHAVATAQLTNDPLANAIPGMGALVVILGMFLCKTRMLRLGNRSRPERKSANEFLREPDPNEEGKGPAEVPV